MIADEFLAYLAAEKGLARSTVAAYRRDLSQYEAFLEGADPTPERVTGFLAHLLEQGASAATRARKLAAVRGFHRFLVAEGVSEVDPTAMVDTPQRPRSLPKALTIEAMTTLLESIEPVDAAARRDRAILEFMYATGARVAEVVATDQLDLDPETSTVLLTGKGNKQRIVPVGSHAWSAIDAWLPDRLRLRASSTDDGALFLNLRGKRLSRQSVWRVVRDRSAAAGVSDVTPHVLRHSVATHMVEGGADLRTVQEFLGHASITTTQVYTRVSPRHLAEVYASSHPRSR